MSTNMGGGADGDHQHGLYEKQLKELLQEQQEFFGSESVDVLPPEEEEKKGREDPDSPYSDQLIEMKEEREALFQFTQEERNSWGNKGIHHKHSDSFLNQIEEARAALVSTDNNNHTMPQSQFTHLTEQGDSITMVDVGHKVATRRLAHARSRVIFPPAVMEAFQFQQGSSHELVGPKGPIFATAKLAGIMGAKRTSDLIPLCHPLPLDRVHVDIRLEDNVAIIDCECTVIHKTGVEMEALTGATTAALTIYDMVKAVSHEVRIGETVLIAKTGGKRNIRDGAELK